MRNRRSRSCGGDGSARVERPGKLSHPGKVAGSREASPPKVQISVLGLTTAGAHGHTGVVIREHPERVVPPDPCVERPQAEGLVAMERLTEQGRRRTAPCRERNDVLDCDQLQFVAVDLIYE